MTFVQLTGFFYLALRARRSTRNQKRRNQAIHDSAMRSFYDIWQMTLRHITEFCVQLFGDHHRILLAVLRG